MAIGSDRILRIAYYSKEYSANVTNIAYKSYTPTSYTTSGNLISSQYDTTYGANVINQVSWDETVSTSTGSYVTFSLRTASTSALLSSATYTDFTATTTNCSKASTVVTCSSSAIPASMKDSANDEWFQYKFIFSSLGGNTPTTTSANISYTIDVPDVSPPAVSITVPTASSTVSGSSVTVTATSTDNVAVTGLQFKLDGVNLGSELTSPPYTIIWDTTSATNGSHILSAVAHDAAPNYATSTINIIVGNPTSISSAIGTFTNGQTITISGAHFGIKSPAAPLIWADFENATGTGQTPVAESPSVGTIQYQNVTTALPPAGVVGSNYAMRGTPQPIGGSSTTASMNPRLYANINEPGTDKLFMSVDRYYDHPHFWDSDAQHMVSNYKILRPGATAGATEFILTVMPPNLYISSLGVPPNPWQQNASPVPGTPPVQGWNREELQFYQGTIDNTDATAKYWQNGIKQIDVTFPGRTTTHPGLYTLVDFHNYWSVNPPPEGAYVYMDNFYADITWARVMLGDAPTFASSTIHAVQIPTAWADGSVTVTVNQDSFTGGTAYLYVIDANGNMNTTGYPVTIGGTTNQTATTTTPAATQHFYAPQFPNMANLQTLNSVSAPVSTSATPSANQPETSSSGEITVSFQPSRLTVPLRPGMQSGEVKNLQQMLSQDKEIYPEGKVTGYFGSLTQEAVKKFQLKYNLSSPSDPAFGLVGPKTRAKLNELYATQPETASTETTGTVTQSSSSAISQPQLSDTFKAQIQSQINQLQQLVASLMQQLVELLRGQLKSGN